MWKQCKNKNSSLIFEVNSKNEVNILIFNDGVVQKPCGI